MSPADRTPPPSKRSLRRYGRLTRTAVPAALVAGAISVAAAAPAAAAEVPTPAKPAASSYPWPPGPDGYPDPYLDPGPGLGGGPGLGLGPLIGNGPLLGDGPLGGDGPLLRPGPLHGPGPLLGPRPGRVAGCDIDSTSSATVPDREFSVAVVRGRTYVGQRDLAQVSGVYEWQNLSGNAGYPGTGVCGASLSVHDTAQQSLSVKIVTFRGEVLENRCTIASAPAPVLTCGAWTPLLGQQPPLTF